VLGLERNRKRRKGISTDPTSVAWNGNSGAAAISLAHHFGAKKIILLGFDMNNSMGGKTHWHDGHGRKAKKKLPYPRHLKCFPFIAEDADQLGLEIINANPDSTITAFPRKTVEEILN
jgi:hypothetical protein